jgi:hypothetical protein
VVNPEVVSQVFLRGFATDALGLSPVSVVHLAVLLAATAMKTNAVATTLASALDLAGAMVSATEVSEVSGMDAMVDSMATC